MLKTLKNTLSAALVCAAFTLPTSVIDASNTPAAANGKNFIKIGRNAIGQSREVKMGLNKSLVIDLPDDAHDILVANPDVADAVTRTSRRIYIFGKQVGDTNLFVFDRNGNQLVSLEISIERDVDGLEEYIERFVRGADVKVEIVNDNIILTGTVPTPQDSVKAVQLAQIFVKGGEATSSTTSSSGSGSGTVISFGDEETRESAIVNLLRIEGEDQVTLKVTVAEIQRNVIKQLGVDILGTGNTGSLTTGIVGDNPFGLGAISSATGIAAQLTKGNFDVTANLRAFEQAGVMRTLAEPTLTAISGEAAQFFAGGNYWVITGKSENDDGAVISKEQIEYGIRLNFKPVVLGPGRISLQVATEVSEPTDRGSVNAPAGGYPSVTSPGIRVRQASTTVELPSGGSMVMAGLIKDDVRQVIAGFPGLSKVPVLGTLFRSREFQRFESELVIIVTPYLVRPVARQALARPDDNFQAPTDGSGIFLGRLNRIYGTVEGQLPAGHYRGNPGFILK